jgi:hypothetical protein
MLECLIVVESFDTAQTTTTSASTADVGTRPIGERESDTVVSVMHSVEGGGREVSAIGAPISEKRPRRGGQSWLTQ